MFASCSWTWTWTLDHREISLLLAGRSERSEGGAGSFPLTEYYTEETDWSSGAMEHMWRLSCSPLLSQ